MSFRFGATKMTKDRACPRCMLGLCDNRRVLLFSY